MQIFKQMQVFASLQFLNFLPSVATGQGQSNQHAPESHRLKASQFWSKCLDKNPIPLIPSLQALKVIHCSGLTNDNQELLFSMFQITIGLGTWDWMKLLKREGVKKGNVRTMKKVQSVSTYFCRDGNFLSIAKSVSVVTCLIQQF